ncbi:MAG TPA: phosphatase PAP2 family protein [Gemmatimonadaceae bacterium]|nr:phosphatase PAP2 family protein [Gemmatimonadaceae bacterium]
MAVIATVLFIVLTAMVFEHGTAVIDRDMILSLRTEATPLVTGFLLAVTFTSGKLAIPVLLIFAAVLYRRGDARAAAYYIGACITAELLNAILKHLIYRVRPHGVSPLLTSAGGYSYPSADAMLAVVIFGLGALLLTWSVRSAALRLGAVGAAALFVIAAAIARVYLGAHWPADVLGGVLAGVACSAFWLGALWRSPEAAVSSP